MRMKYQLQSFTRQQRSVMEYILLEEMSKQCWYAVVHLELWKSEGLIAVQ
jgi:hypothetical protein